MVVTSLNPPVGGAFYHNADVDGNIFFAPAERAGASAEARGGLTRAGPAR